MGEIGHNIDAVLGASASEQIKSFIARIERLESEKAAISEDMKEVYAEAKTMGFDTKILRKVVRLRKQSAEKRQEEEALLEIYLGALEGTPLGDYAINNR